MQRYKSRLSQGSLKKWTEHSILTFSTYGEAFQPLTGTQTYSIGRRGNAKQLYKSRLSQEPLNIWTEHSSFQIHISSKDSKISIVLSNVFLVIV